MESVRWIRASRAGEAARSDGVHLALRSGAWVCWKAGEKSEAKRLKTPGLGAWIDKAIDEVDTLLPPGEWAYEKGVWSCRGWFIRPVEGGWGAFRIVRGAEEKASRQTFDSADRARRWSELRFERGEHGLRGPKPRAGTKAASKLPDVRVTEEERLVAEEALEKAGISYSEFVRASLRWFRENVERAEGAWSLVREEDGVRFQKKPEPV